MTYTIKINCDNAAFVPSPGFELARILIRLATSVRETGLVDHVLRDHNGNIVGNGWTNTPTTKVPERAS